MVKRLKACLNGGRRRSDHPAVPVTPDELAVAAAAAVAAGAEAVHLHPRGSDGAESLHPDDVAAAVSAVRRACPATPIGVSTGLWITENDHVARSALVAGWAPLPGPARPDFASVNLSETGAHPLADLLRDAGIGVEAGVWSVADADRIAPTGWWRILVEMIEVPAGAAVAAAERVLRRLDERGVRGPRLLHGEGSACWPLVAHAGRLGLPTRVGLEDTVHGPGGEAVADNGELVRLGLAVWAGRVRVDPATVAPDVTGET
ncbi:MAG TPA: 3-keto-5-aminohexanoate cleavage protein [Planosporangium sp.]|jgi:uncharacterized protein (DUF849 family)|nr:3-keto-5-aminohexanoate cleavage protein [Planosporangium sp.]